MTEPSQLAIEVAAVLDEFTAKQRAAALGESKRQRITMMRAVGEGCTVSFEGIIEETADATEIYEMLSRPDTAINRLKARSDLSDHYFRILNKCGEIELSIRKLAEDQVAFEAENAERSHGRRIATVMTDGQKKALSAHRQSIRDGFIRIDELKKAAVECQRVLDGENPFLVLEQQIDTRLDQLRAGNRVVESAA